MTIKNFKKDDLTALRAEIAAREEAKAAYASGKGPRKVFGDGANFPFWEQPSNTLSVIRFLPDGNVDNPFFWQEFFTIKLPFQGVKGQTSDEVKVTVPCMKTWKENCPIISETKSWWNDPAREDDARKYYFKRNYLYQGFVVRTELEEENLPENPIRRFSFGPQIHKLIYSYVTDPDLRYSPTDPENGRDFRISRIQAGTGFPDYSTSSWAMNDRALNDKEITAIEDYDLFDLKDFIPKKPTPEEVGIIAEMFKASYEGEEYDPERWGNYYRPAGIRIDMNNYSNSSVKSEETSVADTSEVETTPAKPKVATSPQEAIAELKKRRSQS